MNVLNGHDAAYYLNAANFVGYGVGVGTWLAAPTAGNLAVVMPPPNQSTGTGKLVFNTNPDFDTSINMLIGGAYKYNGLNVIKAVTGQRDYFFGTEQHHNGLTSNCKDNVGIGTNALYSLTGGSSNVGIGSFALAVNTTGSFNLAIGTFALSNNTTGMANAAVGNSALQSNNGSDNLAFGAFALWQNSSGIDNCGFGSSSLVVNSVGIRNAAFGRESGGSCTIGNYNTFVGYRSGVGLTSGNRNTFIGAGPIGGAGTICLPTLSDNVIISTGDGKQRLNINSAGMVSMTSIGIASYNDDVIWYDDDLMIVH